MPASILDTLLPILGKKKQYIYRL